MRLFLISVVVPLLAASCGSDLNMKSIDDGGDGSSRSFSALGPIHSPGGWQSQVKLNIADSAPEIVVEATLAAVNSWNEAAGFDLMTYEGRTSSDSVDSLFSVLEDDNTTIYYETNWAAKTGKAAYVLGTTVWENSGANDENIARGDIILNGENFYFQDANGDVEDDDRYYDIADAESVLVHELGHLLGLDHVEESSDPDSVMHTTTPVGFGFTKRGLSTGDAELIRSLYGEEI